MVLPTARQAPSQDFGRAAVPPLKSEILICTPTNRNLDRATGRVEKTLLISGDSFVNFNVSSTFAME